MNRSLALAIVAALLASIPMSVYGASTTTDTLKVTWTVAAAGNIEVVPAYKTTNTGANPFGSAAVANTINCEQNSAASAAPVGPAAPTPNGGAATGTGVPNTAAIDFGTVTVSVLQPTACDYNEGAAVYVATNSTNWNLKHIITGAALPAGQHLCAVANNGGAFPEAATVGATALPGPFYTAATFAAAATNSATCIAAWQDLTAGGTVFTGVAGVIGSFALDYVMIFPANAPSSGGVQQSTVVTYTLTFS